MKALITGASSGIGRDMARVLAKKGYELVLVARGEQELEKVREELDTKVEIMVMDLSKTENTKALYSKVKDVDLLINNAGFGVFGKFIETEVEKELTMIDTNIKAVHLLTKLYLKEMQEKNRGRILITASIGGIMPGPLMSAYYASKAYVIRLAEGIEEELSQDKSKVKISVLCPGPVDTNFNNVSGGRFKVRALSSEYVAQYAIEKCLKNKFMIVPGILMKIVRVLVKIVPNAIISKFVYRIQVRK